MWIENDVVVIRTIREENIEKCVQARKLNRDSFFEPPAEDPASRRWIEGHRESEDDVLLEIVYRPTGAFVGTIGYRVADGTADIGRLSLYTPELKRLIHGGADISSIRSVALSACRLIEEYLFVCRRVDRAVCEVMEDNRYSNALCQRLGGVPSPAVRKRSDGSDIRVLRYSMDREQYLHDGA